jgi:hypothetical protein
MAQGFMTFASGQIDVVLLQVNLRRGKHRLRVMSGFRRDVDEIGALLGYYAASSGNTLPTFQDNLSVPSSRVKKS